MNNKSRKFKQTEIGKIPEDWQQLTLESISTIVKDVYKPTVNEDLPYIGLEHINQETLSLNSIGHSNDVHSAKFHFNAFDILFGKLRPYFRKVYFPKFSGVCSTDIWVIRPKGNIGADFLFYFLANWQFINVASTGSEGTRMPRADWSYLKETRWAVPSLPTQRAIAKILSDLDEKIELNRQMNKTLESIAQAIFKNWFVDFEFPDKNGKPYKSSGGKMVESELGEIPEGWSVGILDEIIGLNNDSISPREYPDDEFSYFSIPVYDEGQKPKVERGIEIKSNKFLIPPNAILLSKLNPRIPRVWWPSLSERHRAICSTEFIVVTSISNATREYIYSLFNSPQFKNAFSSLVTGTSGSHQRVKPEYLLELDAIIPSTEVIRRFSNYTESLFKNITKNINEIDTLTSIRDSLLPKLMSGRIRLLEI